MDTSKPPTIRQLGGEVIDVRRFVKDKIEIESDKHWSCFNMSIGYWPKKGYVALFRSSNYVYDQRGLYRIVNGDAKIRNQLWFSELDKDFQPKKMRLIDFSEVKDYTFKRGVEDAKIFYRDGAWQFTCVAMEEDQIPRARIAVAKLDSKCTKVVDFEVLPGFDAEVPEKNWMTTYEKNPNFDYIYGPNQVVKDGLLFGWMTDSRYVSMLRGGSNLHDLGDETYLAVLHRTYTRKESKFVAETFGVVPTMTRDYAHYFVRYDENGYIMSRSQPFIFHSPGIEFASGLVAQRKDFLISFGKNDVSCHVARIPIDTVMKSLERIDY